MDVGIPFHDQSRLITPFNFNYWEDAQRFI